MQTIEEYVSVFRELAEPTAKTLWVRDFKAITTHIRGNKENDLISIRRPNEPNEVNEYRKSNYRAVTRHPFNQALTNLIRVMANSGVDIRFPEEIAAELSDTNFSNKTFLGYFESDVIRKMIEMANGFLVWWPYGVGDQTRPIELRPIIVSPENVIHFTSDVFTFLSDEKSEVEYNRKKVNEGKVYYIIMKDGLYKRTQVGKKTDDEYEVTSYYTNPTGIIYPLVLGGDVTSDDVFDRSKKISEDEEYYTSFFSSAVPFADECIAQFSDHQGVLVSSSFPLKEIEQMKCPSCTNGKVKNGDKTVNCGVCNGTGNLPMSPSPYGVLVRPKRDSLTPNETTTDTPVIRYISPDVSILEYGGKVWKDHLQMVKDALNLLFTDESQSGVAKEIDREDKVATLDKIGRHFYNYLVKNSIQIYYRFKFPEREWPFVKIILPSTFVPKTQTQLEAEVKSFREIAAPDVILSSKMRQMMRISCNNDPFEMRIYDIVAMMDPIYLRTFLEKNQLMATSVIDNETMQRSSLIPNVLRTYANETPDFMDLDVETIILNVNALVDELINGNDNNPS